MNKEEFLFKDAKTEITLNVGGQIFECPISVLTRDPYSVLAACCRVTPSIKPDTDGVFFFDRDWWLFRHILTFLRSNILPNEVETLKELYVEASFYRMESLQKAIEEKPVNQILNLSPQISITWPGVMDGGPNPLRRQFDASVYDGSLFKNLQPNPIDSQAKKVI